MDETTFTKIHDGRWYGYSQTGPKWRCDICRREGYGDPHQDRGRFPHWSNACKGGHSPCVWCGRQLTLRKDGTPRVHTRCPERPDEAELLRLLAAEVHADARLGVRGPTTATTEALLARLIRDQPGDA